MASFILLTLADCLRSDKPVIRAQEETELQPLDADDADYVLSNDSRLLEFSPPPSDQYMLATEHFEAPQVESLIR